MDAVELTKLKSCNCGFAEKAKESSWFPFLSPTAKRKGRSIWAYTLLNSKSNSIKSISQRAASKEKTDNGAFPKGQYQKEKKILHMQHFSNILIYSSVGEKFDSYNQATC